jgi:iron(III) transport system ATP-binding protein|tara:strand:+ start:353 stop:1000 length:648 start_codon:yes stop_codon:yes gene_type:complete
MKKFLKIKDLTFSHEEGSQILNNANLDIGMGDFISILGPSGSGKTTLLRLIAGLDIQDSGSIIIENKIIADKEVMIPPEKRNVGLVVQDKALFPHLNVTKNIMFGIRDLKNKEQLTSDIMKLFKIDKHKDKYPHELSGGEQQRVALARALAPKPKLLLLDEPFDGLDKKLKSELHNEVKKIVKSKKITVIMVSHDQDEAALLSDKVLEIKDGKIS